MTSELTRVGWDGRVSLHEECTCMWWDSVCLLSSEVCVTVGGLVCMYVYMWIL